MKVKSFNTLKLQNKTNDIVHYLYITSAQTDLDFVFLYLC